MTSTPRLNRFLFAAFILLSLCVGSAALIWPSVRSLTYAPLRDSLLPNFYLNPQAGRSVHLVAAVAPALEDWVRDSMADFSKQNPLITVEVIPVRGADANRQLNVMTGLPDIWIAESDWARIAAGGIPFEETGTVVAQDYFIWAAATGTPQDVLAYIDWQVLSRTASANPQFRLTVPPEGSMEGMGACLSAAAEFFLQNTPTAEQINDKSFRRWLAGLLEAVPDLTRNPLDQMASRPPQANVAFLPGSDGRRLVGSGFTYQVPRYTPVLNFSLYIRSSWREIPDEEAVLQRKAAEQLRSFLLTGTPQGRLAKYFLERSDTVFENPVRPADENTVYAMQFCWHREGGNP